MSSKDRVASNTFGLSVFWQQQIIKVLLHATRYDFKLITDVSLIIKSNDPSIMTCLTQQDLTL